MINQLIDIIFQTIDLTFESLSLFLKSEAKNASELISCKTAHVCNASQEFTYVTHHFINYPMICTKCAILSAHISQVSTIAIPTMCHLRKKKICTVIKKSHFCVHRNILLSWFCSIIIIKDEFLRKSSGSCSTS